MHCTRRLAEEELADQPVQLTAVHRVCIRAIRKVRLMLARRRFREALRPYDVKDVIEQYTAGHSDLLVRMKNMAARLDTILGRQGAGAKEKDLYESKVSLASRIVKVERQVRPARTTRSARTRTSRARHNPFHQWSEFSLNAPQKPALQSFINNANA